MWTEDLTTVTIDVIVRETGKTLCTLQLLETATIRALKAAIIEQRRGTISTALNITARRCTINIIDLILDGQVKDGAHW